MCVWLFWIRKQLGLFKKSFLCVWLPTVQVSVMLAYVFDLISGPAETQACMKIGYWSENLALRRAILPWLDCPYDFSFPFLSWSPVSPCGHHVSCLLSPCKQTIILGDIIALTRSLHLFLECTLWAKQVCTIRWFQSTAVPLGTTAARIVTTAARWMLAVVCLNW